MANEHRAILPGSTTCICGFRPGCGSRGQEAFEDHIRSAPRMTAERVDADVEAVLAALRESGSLIECEGGDFDGYVMLRADALAPLLAARESAATQPEAGLSDEERASIRLAVNMLRTGGYPSVYRAVERILAARAASYADQPAECEEDVDDYTMCVCGKPMADHADQPAEGGGGA